MSWVYKITVPGPGKVVMRDKPLDECKRYVENLKKGLKDGQELVVIDDPKDPRLNHG